jgi:methionine synthase / methylenetetrahydrofolate reductase(NADPH)
MQPFLEHLKNHVLLADGALGTQIYERGVFINRCFDELNLSNPQLIRDIHADYSKAGAEILTTNTFRASRLVLSGYGLEDKAEAINIAGATLARASAGDSAYVAGSVGPLGQPLAPLGRLQPDAASREFREQIAALHKGGVDCLLLETFLSLDELELAVRAAREVSDCPVIASVAFRFTGSGEIIGHTPEEVAQKLSVWGVDVIGTNCVNGPEAALRVVEAMRTVTHKPISAMPNAGLPEVVEGRTIYLASPEYMAEYARRLVQAGANIVGGCCGTNPAEIAEMRTFIRSVSPGTHIEVSESAPPDTQCLPPVPLAARSPFAANLGKKFQISVEVEPPKGLDPAQTIAGAKFLYEQGIDAVNIADGARAIARMNPMSLALRIREAVPIETIIHYCCRDRNILGMQMDLLGAHALGIHNLMIITGDPPKMGNFPHATAVFDIDAIGLLHFTRMLNQGLDMAGKPLGDTTNFVLGCGCNPGAVNLELEIARYRKKITAGAEYVFSQPVYDPTMLENFIAHTADAPEIPFFVGILPLASLRNAEFLHNEVPGMQIPRDIMERMRKAPTKAAQRQEGITIAQEALVAAKKIPRIQGTYIFPPFGSYEAILEVIEVL